MHAIYQHFSELIEQAVIQLCPNLFLNFPAAAELQVFLERELYYTRSMGPTLAHKIASLCSTKNCNQQLWR